MRLLPVLRTEYGLGVAWIRKRQIIMMKEWLRLGLISLLLFPSAISCSSGDSALADLSPCEGSDVFTVPPIDLEDLAGLVPLGNLNPSGHVFPSDHIYFYIRRTDPNDPGSDPAEVPVYAPGDVRVTMITASEHLSEETPYTDYRITFSPCREIQGYYGHVQSLEDSMTEELGLFDENECQMYSTGGDTYRSCTKSVDLDIIAGERIGTAGREGQEALDFGTYDSRISPLDYANPDRYDSSNNGFDAFHVVCPIDDYEESVRETLEARFGSYDGTRLRSVVPVCGEVEQDEVGTAQGNWFVEDTTETYPEDPHLALVHDNIDPTTAVFSVGTSIEGLSSGQYSFEPADTGFINRDFDQVSFDGNIYCYEDLADGVIVLLQLTTDTSLRIERQSAASCGSGPWAFESSYKDFER